MRLLFLSLVATFLLPPALGLAPRVAAQNPEDMYEKLVRSVVGVITPKGRGLAKLSAGVYIDAEKRLVLTSYAAVHEQKQVGITFPIFDKNGHQVTDFKMYIEMVDKKEGIIGDVIARDKSLNLAVVKLHRAPPTGTQGVKLAEKSVTQATTVWGFGHPLMGPPDKKSGQMFNINQGIVRAIGNQEFITGNGIEQEDFRAKGRTLSITNPLNWGDEGGPLFNYKGELVGIQHGPGDLLVDQLVSLAVDIEEIHKFLAANKIEAKGTLTLDVKAAPPEVDYAALYKKLVRAAVFISVTGAQGGGWTGSGSLIDMKQRLIITNYHVVGKEEWVHVQFPMYDSKGEIITDKKKYKENIPLGKAIKADVLFRDSTRDLAIVKLTRDPPPGTPVLTLADESVKPGAIVWNLGSPGKVNQVFSTVQGIVRCSGLQQYDVGGGEEVLKINAKIITSALPINPGDSGGPFLNSKGELIAVGHAGAPTKNMLSLAIDISEVKAFLAEKGFVDIKGVGTQGSSVIKTPKKDPMLKDPPKEAASGDEKAAASALQQAKLLANNEDARDRYIARLEEVIKKYPETMAGKEAKRLLAGLK